MYYLNNIDLDELFFFMRTKMLHFINNNFCESAVFRHFTKPYFHKFVRVHCFSVKYFIENGEFKNQEKFSE